MKAPCIQITFLTVLFPHRNAAKHWMKLCWINSHIHFLSGLVQSPAPIIHYTVSHRCNLLVLTVHSLFYRLPLRNCWSLKLLHLTEPLYMGVWLIQLANGMRNVCVKILYWFTLTALDIRPFKYDKMVFTICEYLWDENWNNLLTVNGCAVFIISTDERVMVNCVH